MMHAPLDPEHVRAAVAAYSTHGHDYRSQVEQHVRAAFPSMADTMTSCAMPTYALASFTNPHGLRFWYRADADGIRPGQH